MCALEEGIDRRKNYNVGLAFLRMWMSFEVVLCHYWSWGDIPWSSPLWIFHEMRIFAVPIFMLLSFILNQELISVGKKDKIIARLFRLLIPYCTWPILYWIVYRSLDSGLVNGISDLGWSLLMGGSENLSQQLWYLFDMIVLFLFFVVLFRVFRSYYVRDCITYIIMSMALVLQYSNINGIIFADLRFEMIYPLGRICEMLPYACVGILIGRYKIFDKLQDKYIMTLINCIITFAFLLRYDIFKTPMGYGYQSVNGICISIITVLAFYVIPFSRLPMMITKIILSISKYSMGVFCIHYMIGRLLNRFVFPKYGWRINTFRECILIYALCLICSWLIAHIPFKICKNLVI